MGTDQSRLCASCILRSSSPLGTTKGKHYICPKGSPSPKGTDQSRRPRILVTQRALGVFSPSPLGTDQSRRHKVGRNICPKGPRCRRGPKGPKGLRSPLGTERNTSLSPRRGESQRGYAGWDAFQPFGHILTARDREADTTQTEMRLRAAFLSESSPLGIYCVPLCFASVPKGERSPFGPPLG